jgi:hypothetical protein
MYLVTWKTITICRDYRDTFTAEHNAVAATEQEAETFVDWIRNHVTNLQGSPSYSKVSTVEEYQKLYEANGN